MPRPTKEEIVAKLEASAIKTFGGPLFIQLLNQGRTAATALVMSTFGVIGREYGFKVGSRIFAERDYGEWLYDMTWTEEADGFLVSIPVVIESEWKYHYAIADAHMVDHDFQKLVQARVDVRVWVSSAPNHEIAERHICECEKQIRIFSGSQIGDTYLFLLNVWQTGEPIIKRFILD